LAAFLRYGKTAHQTVTLGIEKIFAADNLSPRWGPVSFHRLPYAPQDPMALFALADCLARQGETGEATRRAADCHRAALSQGDERGKSILELVERRFPELKGTP